MSTCIKVTSLTKDYGKGKGIFDFNFEVKKGEVFGLVGTNGSGKTTTIRHMMGFLKGNSGNVKINDLNSWSNAATLKKYIGYVPGQIDFPDVGTGSSFLKIQASLLGIKDFTYMNELIERFKIDITAPLKTMSKGMKQKMALVVAFMAEPDIYLLDEPSTGLDPLMRDTLIDLILEQKAKGKTIFMSSHIFKELEDTCDRVMFIQDGHIVQQISREEYANNPIEQYEIEFGSHQSYEDYLSSNNHVGKMINRLVTKQLIVVSVQQKNIQEFLQELSNYDIKTLSMVSYTLEKYYTEVIEREVI